MIDCKLTLSFNAVVKCHMLKFTSFEAAWENQQFAYAKTKTQISFAVNAKLISALVFATQIVKFLYFLNPKFPDSYHVLRLYSPVCVGPDRSSNCWFSHAQTQIKL